MPFTSKTDIKIYYESAGEGPRILYISGTGGDLRAKPNVLDGPIRETNCLVAYDQRGLGQTEKPNTKFTMAQYADDAAELMDELGWQDAHVVGVSFGGMVAQNMALRHPEKINKLVLCCTSPGGKEMASYPLHEIPADMDHRERLLKMMPISDTRRDEAWQRANQDRVKKIISVTLNMRHADQDLPEFKEGYRKQLEARSQHNVVDNLPNIKMPTLICAGRYDGVAPAKNQLAMCDLLPNARLQWFEGGHMFLIQDKSAGPAIVSFLNDNEL